VAVVKSGFEKDVAKPKTVRPVMEGVNDLGEGTTLSFHPQAFKDQESGILQRLEVRPPPQGETTEFHSQLCSVLHHLR